MFPRMTGVKLARPAPEQAAWHDRRTGTGFTLIELAIMLASRPRPPIDAASLNLVLSHP